MKRIRLEVCPQSRSATRWKVTKDGAKYGDCRTQGDAIGLAMDLIDLILAEHNTATLKIKRADGRVREERTYPRSSDPRRTKG